MPVAILPEDDPKVPGQQADRAPLLTVDNRACNAPQRALVSQEGLWYHRRGFGITADVDKLRKITPRAATVVACGRGLVAGLTEIMPT